MSYRDLRQQTNRPVGLRGFLFVVIGVVLALVLARWPFVGGRAVVAVVLLLATVRIVQSGCRPVFSLKTILLLTGLVACGIVLSMLGGPWKQVLRFPGYEVNIAISPNGKLVAAAQGTSIEIRETQTGRSVQTINMSPAEAATKANQKWTYKMRFTQDGKSLMTVDWQSYPCLMDVESGKELRRWTNWGTGFLAESGTRFIANSVSATNTVTHCNVYDVELTQPILAIESNYSTFRSISPTGSHAFVGKEFVGTENAIAELWSVDDQRLLGTIPIPKNHSVLFFVKFSRDGKLLAVPTSTGVAVWNVMQCRKIAEWKPPKFDHVLSLEWSPDNSRLVASYIEIIGPVPTGSTAVAAAMAGNSTRNAIEHCYLLDQNCQEIAIINGTSPTFSPSGERIATVYGGVCIFDGKTGGSLAWIDSRAGESLLDYPSILFAPDGNWLFHNGSPTVFRKMRSEYWYSVYQLPAFWGLILFLAAIIVNLTDRSCWQRSRID